VKAKILIKSLKVNVLEAQIKAAAVHAVVAAGAKRYQ